MTKFLCPQKVQKLIQFLSTWDLKSKPLWKQPPAILLTVNKNKGANQIHLQNILQSIYGCEMKWIVLGINCYNCSVFRKHCIHPRNQFSSYEINKNAWMFTFKRYKIKDFCKLDIISFTLSVFQKEALTTQNTLGIIIKEDLCDYWAP